MTPTTSSAPASTPSSAPTSRSSTPGGWQRCRKANCVAVMRERDALRAQVSDFESERSARAVSRDSKRGAGDLLRWQADYKDLQRQQNTLEELNKQLRSRQAYCFREQKAAEKEAASLRRERADLKAEVSSLRRDAAAQEQAVLAREKSG